MAKSKVTSRATVLGGRTSRISSHERKYRKPHTEDDCNWEDKFRACSDIRIISCETDYHGVDNTGRTTIEGAIKHFGKARKGVIMAITFHVSHGTQKPNHDRDDHDYEK